MRLLVDVEHLRVLEERPQVARPRIRASLALATATLPGQLARGKQPHDRAAERVAGQLRATTHLDLVLGAAQLRRGRREAVPHLPRVDDLDPLGQERRGGLDPPDRHQLVEVRLQHLAAQLDADGQVRGELQARTRALRIRLGEWQARLAKGALEFREQLRLADSQGRVASREEELPALSGLVDSDSSSSVPRW